MSFAVVENLAETLQELLKTLLETYTAGESKKCMNWGKWITWDLAIAGLERNDWETKCRMNYLSRTKPLENKLIENDKQYRNKNETRQTQGLIFSDRVWKKQRNWQMQWMRCECEYDGHRKKSDRERNECYIDVDCRWNKCDNDYERR